MSEEGFLGRWSRRKRTARRARPAAGVADAAGTAKPAPVGDETPPRRTGRMITDPIGTTVAEPEKTEEATDGSALAAVEPTGEAVDPTADLPPVETLDENSDYTGFLRDGVPEALRNAALRRLWRSSPLFAFRDGLDDYDENFRAAAAVVEGLKRVARGRKGAARRKKAAAGKPDPTRPTPRKPRKTASKGDAGQAGTEAEGGDAGSGKTGRRKPRSKRRGSV